MEDQTSWKSHAFTLLVFGGIVVLCAIFFVLGMLVGRTQGQKLAAIAAAGGVTKAEVKDAAKEEKPELTFYESVDKTKQVPRLEQPIAKPEPPPTAPARPPANVLNFQIAALRASRDAERLVAEVKKKGFKAFIVAPAPTDRNPLYRVQVGPIADSIEAESVRRKLESAGYMPIVKK